MCETIARIEADPDILPRTQVRRQNRICHVRKYQNFCHQTPTFHGSSELDSKTLENINFCIQILSIQKFIFSNVFEYIMLGVHILIYMYNYCNKFDNTCCNSLCSVYTYIYERVDDYSICLMKL